MIGHVCTKPVVSASLHGKEMGHMVSGLTRGLERAAP